MNKVELAIQELNARGYETSTREINKDGTVVTAVLIKTNSNISPTIYPEFESLNESNVRDYINGVEEQITELMKETSTIDHEKIITWDYVKDHVVPVFLPMKHGDVGNTVVVPFHDMTIKFKVIVNMNEEAMSSYTVNYEHLSRWFKTTSELLECAIFNIEKVFELKFMSITEFLVFQLPWELMETIPVPEKEVLYICTNKHLNYGANVILNKNIMNNIMNRFGLNKLIVIPSSIDEVMIVTEDVPVDELNAMIKEANEVAVDPDKRLSDYAYVYVKNKGLSIYNG